MPFQKGNKLSSFKQNNDPNNLISLCSKCYPLTNHDEKYWQNYFNRSKI